MAFSKIGKAIFCVFPLGSSLLKRIKKGNLCHQKSLTVNILKDKFTLYEPEKVFIIDATALVLIKFMWLLNLNTSINIMPKVKVGNIKM